MRNWSVFGVAGLVLLLGLSTILAAPQRKKHKPAGNVQASLQGQVEKWNAAARKAGISFALHRESSGALGVGLENHTSRTLRLYPIVFQDTLTLRFFDGKGRELPLGAKVASPNTGADRPAASIDAGETMEEAVPMKVVKRRLSGPEKASYVMARYQSKSGNDSGGTPFDLGGVVVWSNVLKL